MKHQWIRNLTRGIAYAALLKVGQETKLMLTIGEYREQEVRDGL